jgi:hypothetical protein
MNYEFHVGDYVKTRAGFIGYIDNISDLGNDDVAVRVCFSDGDARTLRVNDLNVTNNFLRIGAYDFTEKEKKIKNLPCATSTIDYGSNSWLVDKVVEARNKINELVDTVNKLMDKEDKE